ncbi:hypothetical protein NBRC116188_03420 [Oceaniserpentilla sp. 4NH20-0058]|uniref:TSUP family transporter n=1 Tax=Oceaniserpentilla sp. 4NH20-0058 TaxID=3127660 RepID=UPI003109F055
MDIASLDFIFLVICALLTSTLAGIIGQGGGLILFAVLALYLKLPLLIAFHSVIQLSSNASRAFLATPHIKWNIITPILFGTFLGATIITPMIDTANWHWIEPIIAIYILTQLWLKLPVNFSKLPKPLFITGLFQGALGMLFGATGPLGNTLLYKLGFNKNEIVASNAVIMSASHLIKILLFMLMGVTLSSETIPLIILSIVAIFGSKMGTAVRGFVSETLFILLFKGCLTVLAIRMLITPFV